MHQANAAVAAISNAFYRDRLDFVLYRWFSTLVPLPGWRMESACQSDNKQQKTQLIHPNIQDIKMPLRNPPAHKMTVHKVPSTSSRLKILALNYALKKSVRPDVSVENGGLTHSRKSMERWGTWTPATRGVKVSSCNIEGLYCEEHIPEQLAHDGLLIYMHGGGFCIGSPRSHRNLVSRIASAAGMRTLAMDYRKAPEHPFPAALNDVIRIYEHALSQGVSPEKIGFAGDSAGGNLVLSSLLKLKIDQRPIPAAACCLSPWTDLTLSGATLQTRRHLDLILDDALLQQFSQHYIAGHSRQEATVSPLFGDLAGLPPLLVQVGAHEVLLDDARRLVENAHAAGVNAQLEIWDEMQHVWHYTSFFLKDGQRAISHIGEFFRQHLGA